MHAPPGGTRSFVARVLGAAAVAVNVGCGGAVLLHGPVADRCESAKLKGCDEIADGVVDVVDGKREDGLKKVSHGAGRNSPDDVRAFAGTLKDLASLPGLGSYGATLALVADALRDDVGAETNAATAAPEAMQHAPTGAGSPPQVTQTASVVGTSESKLRVGMVRPGVLGDDCATVLGISQCERALLGPAQLTDVIVGGGCSSQLMVFVGNPATPRWAIIIPANGTLTLTNAEIPIEEDEKVEVATPSGATSPQCAVTWVARRR